MRPSIRSIAFLVILTAASAPLGAVGGGFGDLEPREVDSKVDSVVLYGVGADVRRTASVRLETGVHELLFTGIPTTGDELLDGLRASASSPWRVVGVDVMRRGRPLDEAGSELAMLEAAIRKTRLAVETTELRCQGIRSDLEFIEAIGIRTAVDATAASGTDRLDLEVIREQLEFVGTERGRLHDRLIEEQQRLRVAQRAFEDATVAVDRRGSNQAEQVVRVRVAVLEAGDGEVSIRHLTSKAAWKPSYSIYSTMDAASMPIEYEAVVSQFTGEDWDDVEMTLSTATPSMPSGPSDIEPIYVDRQRGSPDAPSDDRAVGKAMGAARLSTMELMQNASVTLGGTAVTFGIPRRVSVSSDMSGSTRVRIADFSSAVKRVLVARPVASEKAFLRVDLVNDSPYVMLGGKVALFMEGEFVGPTRLTAVPRGGEFEIWFGPDPSITIDRQVVSRKTDRTGLLGGGRQTSIVYRIEVVNTGDQSATVEVWDRRPVSLDGDIEVRVVDVSPAMADDRDFLEEESKQGLLKWLLQLAPAGAEGSRKTISWIVRVNRSSDLDITPIPE